MISVKINTLKKNFFFINTVRQACKIQRIKKKARLDCPSEKVGLHDAEHNQMNEKLKGKLL